MNPTYHTRALYDLVSDATETVNRIVGMKTSLDNEALSVAYDQCGANLRYEQVESLKEMDSSHLLVMERLASEQDHYISTTWKTVESVCADVESSKSQHSEKVELLEASFANDLREIRHKFETQLRLLKESHRKECEELTQELDLKRRAELMQRNEESNAHFNRVRNIHGTSIFDLNKFYGDILQDSAEEIATLEARIQEVHDKHQHVIASIDSVGMENCNLQAPLEAAEKERALLYEEVQKVDRGNMAMKNFRESSDDLERKIAQTHKDMMANEAAIRKLTADQDKLTALISERESATNVPIV